MRETSSDEVCELSKFLAKKKISHQVIAIPNARIPTKNIEAKLRELRYELLSRFCTKNKIEFLFLGHHLGDVAENFLIRLFRGSGLDGLSTIKEVANHQNIFLVRPMLDCTKEELQEFLLSQKVKWFEDETNADERFLRNKIRKFFDSFPEKALIQKRIKNAADEISYMRDFFDEVMWRESKDVVLFFDDEVVIDREKFQQLNEKIALKILAIATTKIGKKTYKPRLEKLKKFYEYLTKTTNPKLRDFYGCTASFYHEQISIKRDLRKT